MFFMGHEMSSVSVTLVTAHSHLHRFEEKSKPKYSGDISYKKLDDSDADS